MIRVVDANTICKLYFPESGSSALRRIISAGAVFVAPDLIIPEACNAAWAKHRRGHARADQALDLPHRLRETIAQIVPSLALAPRAVEIALAIDHPVYDCIYVALAESRDLGLLTADQRLTRKLTGSPWQSLVRELEPD